MTIAIAPEQDTPEYEQVHRTPPRIHARPSTADRAIRISTATVVIGVAAVAAYVSYRHAHELVLANGEDHTTAALMPLTVDGLIFAASLSKLDATRRGRQAPALVYWTGGLGIVATLAANIAHGLTHGLVGAIVAGWPAVALVLVYELLMKLIRGEHAGHLQAPDEAEYIASGTQPHVPAVSHVLEERETSDPLDAHARAFFAEDLAAGRRPSIRAIRRAFNIGQARAQQIKANLFLAPSKTDGD